MLTSSKYSMFLSCLGLRKRDCFRELSLNRFQSTHLGTLLFKVSFSSSSQIPTVAGGDCIADSVPFLTQTELERTGRERGREVTLDLKSYLVCLCTEKVR